MFKHLWQEWTTRRNERQRLKRLDAALAIPDAQRDLALVVPIILPDVILDTGWVGPALRVEGTPFAVAWAETRPGHVWAYVTHAMAEGWSKAGMDWQQVAFQNLRRASMPGANGEKLDGEGRPFLKVMLQADAFGPSRLLIPDLFVPELGEGYDVALPEQTCAVAWRAGLEGRDAGDVEAMIEGCFRNGTEPMSPNRFAASLFWALALSSGW